MAARGDRGFNSINLTAGEALSAKCAATAKGYLCDPFARPLLDALALTARPQAPLVHRGYYTRTAIIEAKARRWLAAQAASSSSSISTTTATPASKKRRRCQVVSVGAGLDTLRPLFQSASS